MCTIPGGNVGPDTQGERGSETSLPGFNSQASGVKPGHNSSNTHQCREKVVHQHCTESPPEHGLTGQDLKTLHFSISQFCVDKSGYLPSVNLISSPGSVEYPKE